MSLLCLSLGTGNGCATWNYKLLNVPGFSAAAEIVVLTLRWVKVNLLHVAPRDSNSPSSLQQVLPATALELLLRERMCVRAGCMSS